MGAPAAEPKKRRRQNVACDTCKLRRVKCDLSELLNPVVGSIPSSSSDPHPGSPPLHVLIRANPNVECTNCNSKGVKCTTEQILNPARPSKGGRRIEEAKKRFGPKNGQLGNGTGVGGEGEIPPESDAADVNDWIQAAGMKSTDGMEYSEEVQPLPSLSLSTNGLGVEPYPPLSPSTLEALSSFSRSLQPTPQPPGSDYLAATNSDTVQSTSAWIVDGPDQVGQYRGALRGKDIEAAAVWDQMARNQSFLSKYPPVGTQNAGLSFEGKMTSTTDHRSPQIRSAITLSSDVEFDAGLMTFVPKASPASKHPTPGHTIRGDRSSRDSSEIPVSLFLGHDRRPSSSSAAVGQKRMRVEASPCPEDADPWKLWEEVDEESLRRMVKWGRREAVQQQLADRALGAELSKHLVKSFFNCVHPSFPALSPEGFYMEWERAGQRSDRMTPAQETLCAVMEAWGARYSDSPVVLSLPPTKAAMAPKVVQPDGTLAPGNQARAHWGKARLSVCNALVDRARKLIDVNGLLRTPSVTGLQALLLHNQLLNLTDEREKAADHYMENLMIHASIVEQLKRLSLMWDSTGTVPTEAGEMQVSDGQMRMKQRRIFWTVFISDAFNAAASGEAPKIPDEDLVPVARWLSEVEAKLPMSTFKTLAFFLSCYHRIALVARTVAAKITAPNRKPGTVDASEFSATYHACWAQLKTIHRDIVITTTEMLPSCEHSLIGFSPLTYIVNLRMSCPFLLLVMHQALQQQLEFRRNLKESFIFDESPSSRAGESQASSPEGPEAANVSMLQELHMQSVDVLLTSCRSQIYMYEVILPTGTVQAAAIFLRVVLASAQFLTEVPTVEQGYPPNTPGGLGWTWETKQYEVQKCVEALHQLASLLSSGGPKLMRRAGLTTAWSDVSDVLENVNLTMERMSPSKEEVKAYHSAPREYDEQLVVAHEVAEANDKKLFARMMGFWPPPSVSSVLETAMQDLKITNGDTLDVTSVTVPWDQLNELKANHPTDNMVGLHSKVKAGTNPDLAPFVNRPEQTPLAQKLAMMGKVDHDLATAADVPWPMDRARQIDHLTETSPGSSWLSSIPQPKHNLPSFGSATNATQGPSDSPTWLLQNAPGGILSPSAHEAGAAGPSGSETNAQGEDWGAGTVSWIDFDRLANDLFAPPPQSESTNNLWGQTPSSLEELLRNVGETD